MNTALAYGVEAPGSGLVPLQVRRRDPDADDVEIAIEFCGLCHSDVHATRGEWGETRLSAGARPRNRRPGHPRRLRT